MLATKLILLFALVVLSKARRLKVAVEPGDSIDLTWPTKYHCEAKQLYLTANLIEHYSIWYTEKRSRTECNDGAQTAIVLPTTSRRSRGIKYNIYPTTTKEEVSKMACTMTKGTRSYPIEPIDLLPSVYENYVVVENETMYGMNVTKLSGEWEEENKKTKALLWVKYDDDFAAWLPIRYQQEVYNTWIGYLDSHDIWEFYNYEKDFEDDVFDVSSYDCVESHETSLENQMKFVNTNKKAHVDRVFNAYKKKHNKVYSNEEEHAMRMEIFQKNMKLVATRNRQNLGYKLALNHLADRTPEEMKRHTGLVRRQTRKPGNIPFPYNQQKIKSIVDTLPSEYDTRILGLVSNVKNQEDCGSCWTFATTAVIEGAIANSNGGNLIALSNQALIDCAWGYGSSGCDGGTDDEAYQWIRDNGLPTEEEYGPYANKNGFCKIKNMTKTYKIRGFTDITPNSINAIKVALVNHGPITTSVNANDEFSLYAGGIFYSSKDQWSEFDYTKKRATKGAKKQVRESLFDSDEEPSTSRLRSTPAAVSKQSKKRQQLVQEDLESDEEVAPKNPSESNQLNHEVVIVGYGEDNGDDFWIVKNSWGPTWGLDGYMHIAARDNVCGIETEPTYVVV